MAAKYIFPLLASAFLLAGSLRTYLDKGRIGPASKTWFLIATVFAAVSLWLHAS